MGGLQLIGLVGLKLDLLHIVCAGAWRQVAARRDSLCCSVRVLRFTRTLLCVSCAFSLLFLSASLRTVSARIKQALLIGRHEQTGSIELASWPLFCPTGHPFLPSPLAKFLAKLHNRAPIEELETVLGPRELNEQVRDA